MAARPASSAGMGIEQVVVTGSDTELARRLGAVRCPGAAGRLAGRAGSAGALAHPRGAPPPPAPFFTPTTPTPLPSQASAAALHRSSTGSHPPSDFPLRRRGFWLRAQRVIAISQAVRDALVADGVQPGADRGHSLRGGHRRLRRARAASSAHALGLPEKGQVAVSLAR